MENSGTGTSAWVFVNEVLHCSTRSPRLLLIQQLKRLVLPFFTLLFHIVAVKESTQAAIGVIKVATNVGSYFSLAIDYDKAWRYSIRILYNEKV